MKFTHWYPRHINPVRKGWYEVKGDFLHNGTFIPTEKNETTFRFWDEKQWLWENPEAKGLHVSGFGSFDLWRGLTKEMK